jgi:hypothetical protein
MEIPKRLLNKWKLAKEQGDISKISEAKDLHPLTVSNAFKKGTASKETIKAINDFYNEKVENKKQNKRSSEIDQILYR